MTAFPPITNDSLFAKAKVVPALRAATVGPKPTAPEIPFSTTSADCPANSVAASGPTSRRGISNSPSANPFLLAAA